MYQIVYVFDVAVVYLCGCVTIWPYRTFVLGGWTPEGKAAVCVTLFPPVSALTQMVLSVWTGVPSIPTEQMF